MVARIGENSILCVTVAFLPPMRYLSTETCSSVLSDFPVQHVLPTLDYGHLSFSVLSFRPMV